MGIFSKEKPIDQLEEKRERMRIEVDIANSESEIAERKAIVARLKKENGSGWMKILGIKKNADNSTLRSFLTTANQGLRKASVRRR